jgi:hypothetical protein
MVPRSAAIAPPDAPGLPVVVRGGQSFAQALEQADLPFLSAANRYSALPEGPIRYVPFELFAVFTIAPFAEAFEVVAADVDAAEVLVVELELLLPHAASASEAAAAARTPAMRNWVFMYVLLGWWAGGFAHP